jgi:hypothetical protein
MIKQGPSKAYKILLIIMCAILGMLSFAAEFALSWTDKSPAVNIPVLGEYPIFGSIAFIFLIATFSPLLLDRGRKIWEAVKKFRGQ